MNTTFFQSPPIITTKKLVQLSSTDSRDKLLLKRAKLIKRQTFALNSQKEPIESIKTTNNNKTGYPFEPATKHHSNTKGTIRKSAISQINHSALDAFSTLNMQGKAFKDNNNNYKQSKSSQKATYPILSRE